MSIATGVVHSWIHTLNECNNNPTVGSIVKVVRREVRMWRPLTVIRALFDLPGLPGHLGLGLSGQDKRSAFLRKRMNLKLDIL